MNNSNKSIDIGIRIKRIRLEKKLTQDEFGKRIGSARNTVANYENGNRTPSNAVFSLICKEFNVNEDWLRSGTGEMFDEIDRETALFRWAGEVLKEEEGSFRKEFVHMLSCLNVEDWEDLERIALKMFGNKKR